MPVYATVDDLREAGLPDTLTDLQLEAIARRTSAQIEAYTKRWFYPRECTFLLDGPAHSILQIGPPIIAIFGVRHLTSAMYVTSDVSVVDPLSIRVYNRHLTQGLNDPDDRNNPKLEYMTTWDGGRRSYNIWPTGWWPRGVQNIEVHGLFGYTDYDGGEALWTDGITPTGVTPEIIKLACISLAARDVLPLGDISGRVTEAMQGYVTRERTRDQEIAYGSPSKAATITNASGINANADIQALLKPYCAAQGALGAV